MSGEGMAGTPQDRHRGSQPEPPTATSWQAEPAGGRGSASHDRCRCGNWKRAKNKQCAECRGYGKGRHVMPSGYVRVWAPGHPAANADGYVLEHRKVLIDAGYDLDPSQHVHHVNGNKTDNRLENLQVKTAADHAGDHIRERGYIENQHGVHELRGVRVCAGCGESFVPWTAKSKFCSRACANRRRRPAPTHCKRGHEFTAENTRVDAGGWRQCRACDAIRRL